MRIVAQLLVGLVALSQFVAAVAHKPRRSLPSALFAVAGLLLVVAAVQRSVPFALAGALIALVPPVLVGRRRRDLHPWHHVVRFVVLAAVVGFLAWTGS